MNTARIAALCLVFASFTAQAQVKRQPSLEMVEASKVGEPDAAAIRDHTRDLRQALWELNELARIPPTDSRHGQAQKRISELSDNVIKRAIGIYTVLDKSGFAGAIAPLVPRTLPALSNGLSAREREVLAEAGFSAQEITLISVTVQLRARELMPVMSTAPQKAAIEKLQGRRPPLAQVLRIGSGALLIGYDIGSVFIPMLNTVSAFTMVTSVSGGLALVADALDTEQKPKQE